MKRVLLTGVAGFIGFHVAKELLRRHHEVIGLDNINDYYDTNLKYDRLQELGISKDDISYNAYTRSEKYSLFRFIRADLEDLECMKKIFNEGCFHIVCHLAAQAGVRYSLQNPMAYINSNVVGFTNILENCRHNHVEHLIYSSSSSVYGANEQVPFSETDKTDSPVSLYAATKKSNELFAHTYSRLFNLPTTGLRFFTVYGPWGRPDMSPYLFTRSITEGETVRIFNYGKMERDFTYIDDVVKAVVHVIHTDIKPESEVPFQIYNIGNDNPVPLLSFIEAIETALHKKAIKEFLPMQAGDVEKTWAEIGKARRDLLYNPSTDISTGIRKYVDWYQSYYSNKQV